MFLAFRPVIGAGSARRSRRSIAASPASATPTGPGPGRQRRGRAADVLFNGLLDERAAAPADDLITTLAARHADGEDRQDLAANCIFFINAGHQTTTTLLTLGTYLLCTHPGALAALSRTRGAGPPR